MGRSVIPRYRLSLVREGSSPYADRRPNLSSPATVNAFLRTILADEPQECFVVLFLDTKNSLVGYTVAYRGGLNRAMVEPRGVFAPALLQNAAAVVVAHNHPSGDPSPSAEGSRLHQPTDRRRGHRRHPRARQPDRRGAHRVTAGAGRLRMTTTTVALLLISAPWAAVVLLALIDRLTEREDTVSQSLLLAAAILLQGLTP